ncbi:hypothetical protein ACFVYT_29820 [Streptomyces sp. NPDC058290]|uniref:hypothetical protein n=1 Tax=Streptomyces sp. NPDC058290 TaxID=3346426 RepID=UPI0036E98D27
MLTDLGRMSVLVGRPVGEGPDLLVWNNWIGRSNEETVQARQDWMEGTREGEVKGYDGPYDPRSATFAGAAESTWTGALNCVFPEEVDRSKSAEEGPTPRTREAGRERVMPMERSFTPDSRRSGDSGAKPGVAGTTCW